MVAMTLRLDNQLARQLTLVCKERGYKKSGIIQKLIRDFLNRENKRLPFRGGRAEDLQQLVGIVSIGGDSVEDAEHYFE